MIRVGFGFDVHQFEENIPFTVGGIVIPYHKGLKGHSDADVLIHALCDALLGAVNLNDIGTHFPDTDMKYKGIDSKELLKQVYEKVKLKQYTIGNIDATLCIQKPKVATYIPFMKERISQTMQIPIDLVSIKATTTENLGFVGREEGVSASVVVLVIRNMNS